MTVKKVPYIEFMKHAKKVVRGQAAKTRPVLGGVIHREDYIAVTDSHRLYVATDVDVFTDEERNINPITGEEIDEGEFPKIERLIPGEGSEEYSVEIHDVNKLYEYVRAIEIISRINRTTTIMALEFDHEHFSLRTGDLITDGAVKYVESAKEPENVQTVYANIKYVKEALMLFRDAEMDRAQIKCFGNGRPLTITSGNLTALIMPIRKGA